MPVTPFHFGPGLLAKGIAPSRFSWAAFVASQVVIDCETLFHILRNEYPLHRGLHTLIGATAAGAATAGLLIAILSRREAPWPNRLFAEETTPAAVLAGAIVGGMSHPLLDALMHPDVRPFAPWSQENPLLGMVGLEPLHLSCLITGVIGAILLWPRRPSANKLR